MMGHRRWTSEMTHRRSKEDEARTTKGVKCYVGNNNSSDRKEMDIQQRHRRPKAKCRLQTRDVEDAHKPPRMREMRETFDGKGDTTSCRRCSAIDLTTYKLFI